MTQVWSWASPQGHPTSEGVLARPCNLSVTPAPGAGTPLFVVCFAEAEPSLAPPFLDAQNLDSPPLK